MIFRLSIDFESFSHKLSNTLSEKLKDYRGNPRSEYHIVSNRIASQIQNVSKSQLLNLIQCGHVWSPHEFGECPKYKKRRRKQDLWIGCQAIALDFDAGNLSLKEIVAIAKENNFDYSFIHETFSHTKEHPKYRAVILLEEQIKDLMQILSIYHAIQNLYGQEIDSCSSDESRMFNGSYRNSVVYSIEYCGNYSKFEHLVSLNLQKQIVAMKNKSYYESADLLFPETMAKERTSLEMQNQMLEQLHPRLCSHLYDILTDKLDFLQRYRGGFSSRYMQLWNTARALGQWECFASDNSYNWIIEAVTKNSHYKDWDKDPHYVTINGINFGRLHCHDLRKIDADYHEMYKN